MAIVYLVVYLQPLYHFYSNFLQQVVEMPPKYYKRKGHNFVQNTPNKRQIVVQFDNEEHAINFGWLTRSVWEQDSRDDRSRPKRCSINSEYIMEPTMILPTTQMKELPKDYRGHQLVLKEEDITDLGLSYPLKRPDYSSSFHRVKSTEAMPYSCIGLVSFLCKEEPYFSTGTIVGSSVILTAAHNCYSARQKEENLHISFTPAFEGSKAHTFKVKQLHIPDEFKDEANPDRLLYNFCFIEVQTSINLSTYFGCLPIRLRKDKMERKYFDNSYYNENYNENEHYIKQFVTSQIFPNYEKEALLCGFIEGQEGGSPSMVEAEVRVTDNYDVLRYSLDTSESRLIGLGGGPIISQDWEIIGIHSYSSEKEGASSYGLASISFLLLDFTFEKMKKVKHCYFLRSMTEGIELASEDIFYLSVGAYNQHYNSVEEKQLAFSNLMTRHDWSHLTNISFSSVLNPRTLQILLSVQLTNLQELHLQNNSIGDEGCRLLASANWNLVKLYLGYNNITNIGFNQLMHAGWTNFRNFAIRQVSHRQYANMNQNQLQTPKPQEVTHYRWKRYSKSLENQIKDSQFGPAQEGDDFFRLDYTALGCNVVGKWSLANFRKWKWIEHIDLKNINFCSKGCQWIYQAQFKHLLYLKLKNNQIGDSGIKWLSKGQWAKLFYINIGEINNIPTIGIKQLLGTQIDQVQPAYKMLKNVQW